MQNRLTWVLAAGLGAAAMYYLDPARGRYRRSLLRDQLVHAGHKTRRGIGVVRRDAQNRAVGKTANVLSIFRSREPDARVLAARIRACLGRVVSHPSSVEVEASDGVVTLSGPILQEEVRPLLSCVVGVQGVKDVNNRLEVHAEPGRIPGLQGTPRQAPGERPAFLQSSWPPAGRAMAGLAGAAGALYGFTRGKLTGTVLGGAGLLLLGRALTNMEIRRLFGVGLPRHVVEIRKSIRINAPMEQVFKLWDDFENFPSFMTHVRRVRRLADGGSGERWRWTVRGPSGIELEFDAALVAREENRLLTWRTDNGTFMRHAGRVRFHANPDDSTTVEIDMVYNPVAGAVGHALAWVLGADPKHQMDDDLMRMKSFLETGKTPRDAAEHAVETPRREQNENRGNGAERLG